MVTDTKAKISFPNELEIHSVLLYEISKTLNIDDLMQTFYNQINTLLGISWLEYTHFKEKLCIQLGLPCKYKLSFELNIGEEQYGFLSFGSENIIQEALGEELRHILNLIVYPIKNAIAYSNAIQSALQDPLTNLGNRRSLERSLSQDIEFAKRYRTALSILIIDLDNFKLYNDSFGHIAGDEIIKSSASCIQQCARDADKVFRYGGDEFVVTLAKTNYIGACQVGERIIASLNRLLIKIDSDKDHTVSASIGLASCLPSDTYHKLFDRADRALYIAKSNGKNRIGSIGQS